MKEIRLRQADDNDVENITQLFFDTIQNVNIKDYSQEEVNDWSSWSFETDKWLEKMQEQFFVVAGLNNKFVGFSSLAKNGYLDFMFVDKNTQGQVVESALLSEIERKGFIVKKQQLKKSKSKKLINFRMVKYNA